MNISKIFQSKIFMGIIFGILAFMLLLAAFKAGMMVGIRKADFSCKWSDNYHKNFGGPQEGFLKGFDDKNFMEANGVFGQIIKIDGSTIVIKGRDNTEKSILTDDSTVIRRLKDTIKISDLKNDEYIVVIGEPNDSGQIIANFIRVMPPNPSASMPSGNSSI